MNGQHQSIQSLTSILLRDQDADSYVQQNGE